MTFDTWVTFTAVRLRCVWRGGVAEQILSGFFATAQLEMGYNATVSLAVHVCQRARSVASPERRENARHLDLFHRVLSTAVREVDVCVSLGPHRLTVGGPSDQAWPVGVV